MKALITGIEGFVGPHLNSLLKKYNLQTFGTYFQPVKNPEDFIHLDVTNREEVFEVLKKVQPDYIFHLAGFSSVKLSFKAPEKCQEINVQGTRNILDAIVENKLNCKVLIVSSAEVYGEPQLIPLTESHQLVAKSPYGESRIAQEALCEQYSKQHGLFIIISRSFNHTGPGQMDTFVMSSFAKQIVEMEKEPSGVIKVGNLEAIRDFSDVRDVVKAYYLALVEAKKGEKYNVCCGNGYKLKDLLQMMINKSPCNVQVEQDPSRLRPNDIPVLIGDNTKFKKATSWEPEIDIETTLQDLMDYWRGV
jgi:GDP-4-dehydro-6-deoxy-D-mannose reductase